MTSLIHLVYNGDLNVDRNGAGLSDSPVFIFPGGFVPGGKITK